MRTSVTVGKQVPADANPSEDQGVTRISFSTSVTPGAAAAAKPALRLSEGMDDAFVYKDCLGTRLQRLPPAAQVATADELSVLTEGSRQAARLRAQLQDDDLGTVFYVRL